MPNAIERLRQRLADEPEFLTLVDELAKQVRNAEFRLERTRKDKQIASHVLTRTIEQLREQTDELSRQKLLVEEKSRAAEAANLSKSTFLANMSHELRTPLNAILGYAQLLQRDDMIGLRHRESLDVIRDSGDHLLSLINDVLEMSKIEAGRVDLNLEITNLRRLANEVLQMLNHRAREKHLDLHAEIMPEVPEVVQIDRGKLRQILINLVGNAVKFTGAGHVILRMTAQHQRLWIQVEDTGPGIRPEEMERLFDAFVQSEAGRASKRGTGLGLALSRSFARLMDGDLTVESVPGMGATFLVELNFEHAEGSQALELPDAQHVIGIRYKSQTAPRLLVVEDHEATAGLMVNFLRMIGFEVDLAVNGQEAVEKALEHPPDLVLMDIHMPVMDGFEATRAIKASDNPPPVIALSASVFETDQRQVMEAGCDSFLSKPVVQDELLDRIRSYVDVEYQTDVEETVAERMPDLSQSISGFELLDATLREKIGHAARRADIGRMETLAAQLQADHPDLARSLRQALSTFNFSPILDALES